MKLSTINSNNEGTSRAVRHIPTQASVNTEIAAVQTKGGTTPPTNIMKHLRRAAGSKKPDILPAFLKEYPSITLEDISDIVHKKIMEDRHYIWLHGLVIFQMYHYYWIWDVISI